MKEYFFYDWDCMTNEDLEFSREAYIELLNYCFSHSQTVSFIIRDPDIAFSDWLEQFRVSRLENTEISVYGLYKTTPEDAGYRFYRTCPELHKWMLEAANSMFEWLDGWGFKNPEDPCFFREDGRALFFSTIHEGELALRVDDEENIERILTKAKWVTERWLPYS